MRTTHLLSLTLAAALCAVPGFAAMDQPDNEACSGLPTAGALRTALAAAADAEISGLNMNMWGTIVNRDGIVCAVAFTGSNRGSQWPGSRVISAQRRTLPTPSAWMLQRAAD